MRWAWGERQKSLFAAVWGGGKQAAAGIAAVSPALPRPGSPLRLLQGCAVFFSYSGQYLFLLK